MSGVSRASLCWRKSEFDRPDHSLHIGGRSRTDSEHLAFCSAPTSSRSSGVHQTHPARFLPLDVSDDELVSQRTGLCEELIEPSNIKLFIADQLAEQEDLRAGPGLLAKLGSNTLAESMP